MPKVLIVDDSLADRVRARGIAAKWQECAVIDAENGKTALLQIQEHMPDLVVTDLHMPEMTGLELVAAVKDNFPNIPVILMTGQGSEEVAAEALRIGAASYVPKLRLAEDLAATMQQVFQTSVAAHTQSRLMHYMTDTVICFSLPNDIQLIEACLSQLLEMLRCLPLGDESERLRVGIAVEEALKNACYHGNLQIDEDKSGRSREEVAAERCWEQPYLNRRITVKAEMSREQARFVITDEGDGFDTSEFNAGDEVSEEDGLARRGLRLMRSVMDSVAFNDAGNQVTMVRLAVQHEDFDDDDPLDE